MKLCKKHLFGLTSCVAVLTLVCVAGKQREQASAQIDRAVQLSNIRDSKASAFRLKAALAFYEETGTVEGTYTESWVSGSQWRRETIAGAIHRVEVASGSKQWLLEDAKDSSIHANQPGLKLSMWEMDLDPWKNGQLEKKSWHDQKLSCVVTGAKSALCFDTATGLLAITVVPLARGQQTEDETCEYGDYQRFGEKLFPRSVRCFDNRKRKLEMRVLELEAVNNFSPDLFSPLDGAKESFNCPGILKQPKPIFYPDPPLPKPENPDHPVVLQVIVGKNGKPRDVNIVRSIDKDFDRAAVNTVRGWKFEPAKCDGEPIDREMMVEIKFNFN